MEPAVGYDGKRETEWDKNTDRSFAAQVFHHFEMLRAEQRRNARTSLTINHTEIVQSWYWQIVQPNSEYQLGQQNTGRYSGDSKRHEYICGGLATL